MQWKVFTFAANWGEITTPGDLRGYPNQLADIEAVAALAEQVRQPH